jgi:hypothetical protein
VFEFIIKTLKKWSLADHPPSAAGAHACSIQASRLLLKQLEKAK